MIIKSLLVSSFILVICSGDELPRVKTPLGEVQGHYKTSLNGRNFSAFEGIPYAKPPIGDRRFKEPESVEPWVGVWNATFLTTCAQTNMNKTNSVSGDEDCLHVNVYVPRTNFNLNENLDVIVHIHGGAYMYCAGSYAPPDVIMDRDVVYVNFNYRLGILGFLSTEDDAVPGNNGLKDQVLALKWVQNNIASFGGNPNSVTITGVSAGGSSVHLHYFSELSRGLFHRGFSQSGTALNPWSIQENPLIRTKHLADAVGCPTDTTRIMVDCLKQRPYKQLLYKMSDFFSFLFMPVVPFGPVVEKGSSEPFLKEDPYILLKKGQVYDVPWISSTTIHEGLFPVFYLIHSLDYIDEHWEELAPSFLEFNNTLSASEWKSTARKIREFYLEDRKINKENLMKFVDLFSDRLFLIGAETAVKMQAKVNKSPVYYYTFGYPGDNNPQQTVSHGFDAKYFYGPSFGQTPFTPNELKMKDALIDMLVSFAKTGVPTINNIEWKPTKPDDLTYLLINGIGSEGPQFKRAEKLNSSDFWNSLNFKEGENLISAENQDF